MIRYTVLWRRDVENELVTIWCDSTDRQGIAKASDRIDSELKVDAHLKGTEFPDGLRVFVVAPLVAYFRFDEADRKVFVEAIQVSDLN
ncbi:MAG: hypothetical protein WD851_04835 [Pirellulales bacterium]